METHDADHSMDRDQAMNDAVVLDQFSIGIGCSPRAEADDIVRLLNTCIEPIQFGMILATIERRAAIVEIVAAVLGLRLVVFSASLLAEVEGTTTQSLLALSTTGTSSVAEAAALASLGPSARLVVPQQKGRLCTCALAVLRTSAHA